MPVASAIPTIRFLGIIHSQAGETNQMAEWNRMSFVGPRLLQF